MRFFRSMSWCVLGVLGLESASWAHSFNNIASVGATNSVQSGLAFMTSKTEYVLDSGEKFELDRKLFGVDVSSNLGDDIAVFGQAAMIMRTELEDSSDYKGDGYLMGMGVKMEAFKSAKISTVPFVQFNYLTEELKIKEDEIEAKNEIDIYEVSVGALVSLTPDKRFSPYVGVELYPINDGESKSKVKNEAAVDAAIAAENDSRATLARSKDFERDDILALRVGGNAKFNNFSVRGEAALIAETTFTLATGFEF